MLYILSMGEGARFTPADLMREGKLGRASVYRLLRELREVGYVDYVQLQRNGRYGRAQWFACETALEIAAYPCKAS
jgi:DNA-binding IclR family transcriptional regulator